MLVLQPRTRSSRSHNLMQWSALELNTLRPLVCKLHTPSLWLLHQPACTSTISTTATSPINHTSPTQNIFYINAKECHQHNPGLMPNKLLVWHHKERSAWTFSLNARKIKITANCTTLKGVFHSKHWENNILHEHHKINVSICMVYSVFSLSRLLAPYVQVQWTHDTW